MTSYSCLRSVPRNLPAMLHCVRHGIISLKTVKVQPEGSSAAGDQANPSGGSISTANLTAYLDDI
jgi:hypothetical protein